MTEQETSSIIQGAQITAGAASEGLAKQADDFIDKIEHVPMPRILKAAEIYKMIKAGLQAIPLGHAAFDAALERLAVATKALQERTHVSIAIDEKSVHELIDHVDNSIATALTRLDDGLDVRRSRLASALRTLLGVLVQYRNWVAAVMEPPFNQAKTMVRSHYEQMLEVVAHLANMVKEGYPHLVQIAQDLPQKVTSKGSDLIDQAQQLLLQAADSGAQKVTAVSESTGMLRLTRAALLIAQPYVQRTVLMGQPYLRTVMQHSQPLMDRAKPLLEKAQAMNEKALHGKFGPLVSKVEQTAGVALETTKHYCIPENPRSE